MDRGVWIACGPGPLIHTFYFDVRLIYIYIYFLYVYIYIMISWLCLIIKKSDYQQQHHRAGGQGQDHKAKT